MVSFLPIDPDLFSAHNPYLSTRTCFCHCPQEYAQETNYRVEGSVGTAIKALKMPAGQLKESSGEVFPEACGKAFGWSSECIQQELYLLHVP